jgi:hypothetical protein
MDYLLDNPQLSRPALVKVHIVVYRVFVLKKVLSSPDRYDFSSAAITRIDLVRNFAPSVTEVFDFQLEWRDERL